MAITFLGYRDTSDTLIEGKRRLFIGMDSEDNAEDLPVDEGLTVPGGKTAKPAPWSVAAAADTGAVYVLTSDMSWTKMSGADAAGGLI